MQISVPAHAPVAFSAARRYTPAPRPPSSDPMAQPTVPKLAAHGADIPVIGFGTGMLTRPVGEIVAAALRAGYRHLDAARKYGTEEGVGEGLRAAKIPRGELFITTKV